MIYFTSLISTQRHVQIKCKLEEQCRSLKHAHMHKHSNQGDQSLHLASEIHIMGLLSYSTLITPIPVTSQRGEAAVFTEGREKEEKENSSLRLSSMSVRLCTQRYYLCDSIYDKFEITNTNSTK